MAKRVTSEQKKRIIELAASGTMQKEIAKTVGVSDGTVSRTLSGKRISTIVKASNHASDKDAVEYWKAKCRKLEDFVLKIIAEM